MSALRSDTVGSDAARVGRPDVLVDLKVEARRGPVAQHPGAELTRVDRVVRWREQHLGPSRQPVLADDLQGPAVVLFSGEHELDRVALTERAKRLPTVAVRFARAGGLHVHDADD